MPTTALTDTVIGIGNTSGAQIDKFAHFGLTADEAQSVAAPLIRECHAGFECRMHDDALVDKYNFFIFEVVKAHVAIAPRYPKTIHYRGDGRFMLSGPTTARWRGRFKPHML
jgi:flavin reductase (DIM6/NTAB) family NADH-FMN oxidoreductase RutF